MHKVLRYSLAVVCLLLSGLVGATVLVFNSLAAPPGVIDEPVLLEPPMANSKVNLLILGADAGVYEGGVRGPMRTDTMMVASFDPDTLEVHVLSIPRDSRVTIPGRANLDKITHAHAYGGIQLAVDTVQLLLDVPIHYYVRVDHAGFRKIINAIGGVDYYVEFDMDYEDPYQDLYIHLKQGQQKLNGDKAEQYVRYRGDGSDIARIKRQQKFMIATLKTVLKPANLLRINQLIDIVRQSVRTNIDAADILKYLPYLDKITDQSVVMHMAPGEDGWVNRGSYWLLNYDELNNLLNQHFWDKLSGDARIVTIDIEDASGQNMGARAKEILERRGFTVTSVTTAATIIEKTKITAHNSNDVAGLMVYRVLRQGVPFSEKAAKATDVTITLGADFSR